MVVPAYVRVRLVSCVLRVLCYGCVGHASKLVSDVQDKALCITHFA